jgi:hypothetical protein
VPLPEPDRNLRRLITDLADLDAEDITAILDRLDPVSRGRADALLHDYAGQEAPTPRDQTPVGFDQSSFSPWLTELFRDQRSMTPHAHRVLVSCAAGLHPAPAKPADEAGGQAQSLISRIGSFLSRRRSE